MRTAAKLVGIGAAATSGLKGATRSPPSEQLLQNVSRPVSTVLSSSSQSQQKKSLAAEVAPLQDSAASWDLEDWDVADDGVLVMQAGEATPRIVFGGVPTFDEAKAATTELKDAIETIYLNSSSSECECYSPVSQGSVVSPFNTELETTFRDIEAISKPPVPKHAFQAFQLLSSSPEAQAAVASIACDPNVWNAVMQNPAVKNFFQSQQTAAVSDLEEEGTHVKFEEMHDCESKDGFANLMAMLQNLKITVDEMLTKMSNYLQKIFWFSSMAEKSSADTDGRGNAKANFMDQLAVGGTFIGLAVLVMMVVVLKRA